MDESTDSGWGPKAVLHLDYLSCLLTVVSTVLVGRKHWMGLVIASINSVIICFIGLHTVQYGLIAANIFCVVTYAISVRSWRQDRKPTLVTAAPHTAPAPKRPQPRPRAAMPSRKEHTGLFLAYSSKSFQRITQQTAEAELRAASSLMESGAAIGATAKS